MFAWAFAQDGLKIIEVDKTEADSRSLQTTGGAFPAASPLFNEEGEVVGFYDPAGGGFQAISTFSTN